MTTFFFLEHPMIRRYAPSPTLLLHAAVVLLGACIAMGSTTAVKLMPVAKAHAAQDIQLQSPATFKVGIGYGHELPAGSRWRAVGSLAQGTVYRPLNLAFMVQSPSVDEAYPVVQGGKLQGFFLPADASFTAVKPAVPLALRTLRLPAKAA